MLEGERLLIGMAYNLLKMHKSKRERVDGTCGVKQLKLSPVS